MHRGSCAREHVNSAGKGHIQREQAQGQLHKGACGGEKKEVQPGLLSGVPGSAAARALRRTAKGRLPGGF